MSGKKSKKVVKEDSIEDQMELCSKAKEMLKAFDFVFKILLNDSKETLIKARIANVMCLYLDFNF